MYPEILLKREKGSLWEVCDLREGGRNRERENEMDSEERRRKGEEKKHGGDGVGSRRRSTG